MADTNSKIVLGKARGRTGTVILNGIISSEDYNADLSGKQGLLIFDEMRKSDPAVGATLDAMKQPLIGVDWYIQPASDSKQDVAIADAVEDALFKRIDFTAFLWEVLTSLEFGFYVGEKIFTVDMVNGQKIITLDAIEIRKQKTIYKWEMEDHTPGISQITYEGEFQIEQPRLVTYTLRREGQNFQGVSMLRRAYKPYYIKTQLEKIQAIAMERQGSGVVKIKVPENAPPEQIELAKEAARELRANEESFLLEPDGFEIDFMDMHSEHVMDVSGAIEYHDRQILLNALVQFLSIGGHGSSGSYAASADHSRLFEQCLENIAASITKVIDSQVVKQLVDLNWTVKQYPTLAHGRIADDNVQVLSQAMLWLSQGGFLTPTPEIEEFTRKVLHAPEMEDDLKENYPKKAAPVAEPSPDNGGTGDGDPGAKPAGGTGNPKDAKTKPGETGGNPDPKAEAEKLIEIATETRKKLIAGVEKIHAAAAN